MVVLTQILAVTAAASLLVWIFLIFFRGGFWRADQRLADNAAAAKPMPPVAAVIPARNEAETIEAAARSVLEQAYDGEIMVFVVDDNSTDGTAECLATLAGSGRVHVIDGADLPAGWTGKMWAVSQGLAAAAERMPDAEFVLLTDADIEHDRKALGCLVAKAEQEKRDLVSLMVLLRSDRFWEKFLSPAFVFFFQKLYPFRWVNDPSNRCAGAAGGCMLVRRAALERIGGVESIRDRVIDDCALAAAIKPGGSIWLGLAEKSRSLRGYDDLAGFWDMVARTAFVQLRHSWPALAGTIIGMVLIYLVPPVLTIIGLAGGNPTIAVPAGLSWALMLFAYLPTLTLYRRSPIEALGLPVAGLLYSMMTIDSAWRGLRGRGAGWKGRNYGAGGAGET